MLQQMTNEIFHLTSMKGFPVIVYNKGKKYHAFCHFGKRQFTENAATFFFNCLLELFVENA